MAEDEKYIEIEIEDRKDTLIPRPWPITPPRKKEEIYAPWVKDPRDPDGSYARFTEGEEDGLGITWEKAEGKPWALDGFVVLDCCVGDFNGAFAASNLAELGAKVIKIEPPEEIH